MTTCLRAAARGSRHLGSLGLAVLCACQLGAAGAGPSPSRATPTAEPASALPRLRLPPEAVLDDAAVALPRLLGRDHLGAAEAARDQPDEQAALALYSGWGWVEASTRSWGAGGRRVDATLLLTQRARDGTRAFDFWAAEAGRPPLAPQACPGGLQLDDCRYASGGGRTLLVGRLDAEVFRLSGVGADVAALAPSQAQRLRA